MIVREEFHPFLIDERAVGLQCIVDFDIRIFLHLFRKMNEIRKSCHGRLPSLEADIGGSFAFERLCDSVNDDIGCFLAHHAVGSDCPVFGNIRVETISASQIA